MIHGPRNVKKNRSLVPEFYVLHIAEPALDAVCFRNKQDAGKNFIGFI